MMPSIDLVLKVVAVLIPSILVLLELLQKTKISERKLYKKISLFTVRLWSGLKENKFILVSIISGIIAISLLGYSIYHILYPSMQIQEDSFHFVDLARAGTGSVLGLENDGMALAIEPNRFYIWERGWDERKTIKKIEIDYSTKGSFVIMSVSNVSLLQEYLNGTYVTFTRDDLNPVYKKNKLFNLLVQNFGDYPFYIHEIRVTEEASENEDKYFWILLLSYPSAFIWAVYMKKHKKLKEIEKDSKELLLKEAKLADKIHDVTIQLEESKNSIKQLEKLKRDGKISSDYYHTKRDFYDEKVNRLTDEEENIKIEIKKIIKEGQTE